MNPSRTSIFFFVLLVVTFSELAHCLFETGQPITIEHYHAGSLIADVTTSLSDSAPIYSYVNTTVEIVDDQIIITSDNAEGACPGATACNVQFKLRDKARAQPNFLRANVSSSSYDAGTFAASAVSPNEIVITLTNVVCLAAEGDICELVVDVVFSGQLDPTITNVVPSQLPPAGALITITGSHFSGALVNISKAGKNAVCAIVSATADTIVCRAPAGAGAGYTLTVTVGELSDTRSIKYAEPYLTGSKSTINDWQTFLTLYGGNFNPKDLRVELTQENKKRSASNPTCEVISATTSQIDCALNGIIVGALNAVVRTGGAVTNNGRPKVVAVVSKDAKTTSLTCRPPAGTPDLHQTEMCNCWSGHAPSDITGTDCDNHAKCAQNLATAAEEFSDVTPRVPETSFVDDKLIIKQTIGIASNRRSTFINFAVPKLDYALPETLPGTEGASSCNYPGPLWAKSIDSLDCEETFEATLPWSQNGLCGFVQDLNASSVTYVVFKSVLVTRFIEIVTVDGKMVQRVGQYSHLISVQFLAQKVASSDPSAQPLEVFLAEASKEKFITSAVVADSVYDVNSGNVLAYVKTTAAWPFQLNPTAPAFYKAVPTRAGVNVEIAVLPNDAGDKCNTAQDSTCTQKFLIRINVGENCDISGTYTFRDTLYCRDVNSTAEAALCDVYTNPVEFSIRVKTTDLCDPTEALDATKEMSTSLDAFFEKELVTPTSEFQTGDMIFWKLTIVNPQASIDKVELNTVALSSSGPSDVLYEDKAVTAVGTAVGFDKTNALSVVYAGDKAEITFSHKYLRSALSNTIAVLSNTDRSVQVETTVVVDIYYHGNQKRETMDISSVPTQSIQSRSVRVVDSFENHGAVMQEGASSMNGSSTLVSSFVVISLAIAYLLMM